MMDKKSLSWPPCPSLMDLPNSPELSGTRDSTQSCAPPPRHDSVQGAVLDAYSSKQLGHCQDAPESNVDPDSVEHHCHNKGEIHQPMHHNQDPCVASPLHNVRRDKSCRDDEQQIPRLPDVIEPEH